MKKTLMVLSFALCASFAFAQVKTADRVSLRHNNMVSEKAVAQQQSNYKASIFTKDEEVVRTWDFSADNDGFTAATMTTSTTIDGMDFVAHTGTEAFAKWTRIPGTDSASVASLEQVYSGILSYYSNRYHLWEIFTNVMDSTYCSGANGFMLVSLRGSTGSANYNSYIQFAPVDLSAQGVYDVKFFSDYRKYYDQCFLDYSTDGATWHTMEILKTGVDIEVNQTLTDYYRATLPTNASSNATILRIRHYTEAVSNSGGWRSHGYLWMIDDVQVIKGESNRWKGYGQYYSEGAYQMMPQGFELPLFWYTDVTNNGAVNQTNATVKLFHIDNAGDSTLFGSYNAGTIQPNPTQSTHLMYDPLGWAPDSIGHEGWYSRSTGIPTGEGSGLPTDVIGEHMVGASVVSDDNELRWRSVMYTVNQDAENNYGVWGHDNGILTNMSAYTFGYTDDGVYVTDDSWDFMDAGYRPTIRYTVGDYVPVDENGDPWVIRGVQYVASTTPSKMSGSNVIAPYLAQDIYPEDEPSSVSFQSLSTGVNTVTVEPAFINDSALLLADGGWKRYGDYKVINVEFPMQPELTPFTSYRVGYVLQEDGLFCVAKSSGNSYIVANDSTSTGYKTQYFSNDSTIAKYGTSFITSAAMPNGYDGLLYDGGWLWSGFYTEYYPAIRLLVGPRAHYTMYTVQSDCEWADGDTASCFIYGDDGYVACDTTIEYPENSSILYYIGCADYYTADVWVDGELIDLNTLEIEEGTGMTYYIIHFDSLNANHTIRASFRFISGIDRAASNVSMNLQPNPASSQVNISIEGVNGLVNCSLIDMSGRVVYNANINAENTETINVSNLAKGAYFVRITNNDFTKVEKLIVR